MRKPARILTALILFSNYLFAQNSMVGDGFGGRGWYVPHNYQVGAYSAYTVCGDSNQLYAGGQLQRVAIARSLVANSSMLLMDEPFSALDSVTRKKMQNFVKDLFIKSEQAGHNPTFIIVTHDEREAAFLAKDVVVMGANPGRIKSYVSLELDYTLETRTDPKFFEATNYLESII